MLKIKRSKISIDSKIYQIIANLLQIIAGIVSLFFLSAMIVDVDKLFLVFFIIIFALQLVYSKKITNANLKLYRVQDNDQRKHTYFNGLMRSRESIKEIRISNCMEWIEGKRKQVYSKIEYEHLRFIKKWNLINAIWTILGTGMETLIFLYLVYGYSIEIFSVEEVVLIIQSQEVLILYLCVYFALNICIDIFEGVEGYIQTKVSYRINEELNVKINSKISKIRLNIFDDERFYDLLERLNDNIGVGALEFIKSSISISSGLISITIYVVILYSVQWYFPFVFILASIPYYFVALKESKELYSQEKELNKLGRLLSYTENIIFDRNVIKEIHIFQLYEFIVKKANLLRDKIVKKKVRLLYKQGKRKLGINVLKNLSLVGCLAITYINIKYNNGQIGDFMAIYLAIKNLLTEIVSFVSEIKTLNTYDLYLEDLNFFYSYPEEKCLSHKIENKEINFKNVFYLISSLSLLLYLNNVNSKLIVLICYLQGGICALYGYQKSKEDKHKLVIELE